PPTLFPYTTLFRSGDEVAGALELERLLRRSPGGGRFHPAADDLLRVRVEVVAVGLAVGFVVRLLDQEQAVVQADLRGHGMPGRDPVDGALDLAIGAFHARARFRVQPAAQLDHVARLVLDHFVDAHDAGAAQAGLAAGDQALPALGRDLGEVLALDP